MASTVKAKSYLSLFVINLASQVVGFVFQTLTARFFGASTDLDGYLAGLAIPQYLILIINTGVSSSLLPAYYGKAQEKRDQFLGNLFMFLAFFCSVIVAVGALFAPFLFHLFFHELPAATAAVGITVCRYGFISVLTAVLINFLSSVHYIHKKFAYQALVPAIGQAVTVALMAVLIGLGINSLLIAYLAAQVLQVLMLLFHSVRVPRGKLSLRDPEVMAFLILTIPMMLSTCFTKSTGLVERYLAGMAAKGAAGTISHVDYASKIVAAIAGLTTNVLPILIYPDIAAAAADKDHGKFNRIVNEGLFLAFFIVVPIIAFGRVAGLDLIQIFFQRGRFTAYDSARVDVFFQIYLFSLVARAMGGVTSNAMYALKLVNWVAIIGPLEASLYIAYTYWLTRKMGATGIPLGFMIYFTLSLAWSAVLISCKTRTAGVAIMANYSDYLKVLGAGLVAFLVGHFVGAVFSWNLARILGAGLACAASYLLCCHLVHIVVVRHGWLAARSFLAKFKGVPSSKSPNAQLPQPGSTP
ncbi:MAG TPA: lipid II flippase MurJ [Bryobacteraceae bacterium]|nr:lipid II flippase MurJ [Bryobacteraceae bacterium]